MNSTSVKGYVLGCIASVSYGLNPLFALPLYASGIQVDSVLFYRYAFAVILLAILMRIKDQSFALKRHEIMPLAVMGLMFSFSSLFLFQSFNYMDAGIASTILFVYPVFVALIMAIFFKEKLSTVTMGAIGMAFVGISMLYKGEGGATLSALGIVLVFMSSLLYACYIVGVNRSSLKHLPSAKMTFYSILFGLSVYVVRLRGGIDLQILSDTSQWSNVILLALLPTLLSLITITQAIHYIGSTPAAILGALEPLTALFVGVVVFGEQLTGRNMAGILLILLAVSLIILGKRGWMKLKMALLHFK